MVTAGYLQSMLVSDRLWWIYSGLSGSNMFLYKMADIEGIFKSNYYWTGNATTKTLTHFPTNYTKRNNPDIHVNYGIAYVKTSE